MDTYTHIYINQDAIRVVVQDVYSARDVMPRGINGGKKLLEELKAKYPKAIIIDPRQPSNAT